MPTVWEINRSERAKQTRLLAPVLASHEGRRQFFEQVSGHLTDPITNEEAADPQVIHFAWPLRDLFTHERDNAGSQLPPEWERLRRRWVLLLELPPAAADGAFWRHPAGSFKGDPDFVVHPCNRTIGWTLARLRAITSDTTLIHALVEARQVMNTEADCLIDTGQRLIFIECKDKTPFIPLQAERQRRLGRACTRAWNRPHDPVHIEVGSAAGTKLGAFVPWTLLEDVAGALRTS